MENYDYYDHSPEGVLARRIKEFNEKGLDVETVVFVQQGGTLDKKMQQRGESKEWIKEKEKEGWKCEGVPLSMSADRDVQIMTREKQKQE